MLEGRECKESKNTKRFQSWNCGSRTDGRMRKSRVTQNARDEPALCDLTMQEREKTEDPEPEREHCERQRSFGRTPKTMTGRTEKGYARRLRCNGTQERGKEQSPPLPSTRSVLHEACPQLPRDGIHLQPNAVHLRLVHHMRHDLNELVLVRQGRLPLVKQLKSQT